MNIWYIISSLVDWTGISANRAGWNGNHRIYLQTPTETSKMTKPYIYMVTEQWDIIPWVCSQSDLLANDWELIVWTSL